MHPTLKLLSGQFCKPALYLIDPGRRGRREMNIPVRTSCQPCLDLGSFVRGIIVHYQMYVGTLWHLRINLLEEIEKLFGPVTFVTLSNDRPGGDIQRRK